MKNSFDVGSDVSAVRAEMVEIRRDIHAHPEMAFREERTAGIVEKELRSLGIEVKTGVAKTGVVGLIRGSGKKTIGLRADMDALPILEVEKKTYRSSTNGVMHACGHDGHVAILLGVAKVLAKRRAKLKGNVKLIFQPAEESPGGALPMINAGVLKNPDVDAIFGLHLWNDFPVGRLGIRPGPLLAAADEFNVVIKGRGGHGAAPHQTHDPIVAAAHAITALQAISSRMVDPLKPVVISVGRINGGKAFNVIPDDVEFAGTVRSFDPALRDRLPQLVRSVIENSARAHGADFTMEYRKYYPATINDKSMTSLVQDVARTVVHPSQIDDEVQTLGGEDMSYFLQKAPGCFFFLGSRNEKKGFAHPHHSNKFDFDEACLPLGAEMLVRTVEKALG